VNFLALLGWSPGGDRELFSRDELIPRFALDGISGGNAIFNPEKLDWFNQQHILRMSAAEILTRIAQDLEAAGLARFAAADPARTARAIDLVKPRARKLTDLVTLVRPFIADEIERDPAAVGKHLAAPDLAPHLDAWRDRLQRVQPFAAAELEAALRSLAEERGLKAGTLIHATRVAVTGQAVSPGIFEVLEVMGRDRVISRLTDVAAARP
jgi:glutamyl-tRNA synthetase